MDSSDAPTTPLDVAAEAAQLSALDPCDEQFATDFVDLLLTAARRQGVSDVHLQPTPGELEVSFRLDGVLHRLGRFPRGESTDVVTRLKVKASLLTYRTDVPQEGRIPGAMEVEMRISTFPTLHGERAVVRVFAEQAELQRLNDLGFDADLTESLRRALLETSGALLVTGPAGSGKTTTLYACLREIAQATGGARSLVSLEDPIESALEGVAQAQVNQTTGLTLAEGVRSMMRQDPEVLMIGEIRDPATASAAMGASLTGHLVMSSFHASSTTAALRRLADMGVEAYMLRSGLLGVLSQRLARRLCSSCKRPVENEAAKLDLKVSSACKAVGCPQCQGTGYHQRLVITEWLSFADHPLDVEQLGTWPASKLESAALAEGMRGRWQSALAAVERGATSPSEIRRVLGWPANMPAG